MERIVELRGLEGVYCSDVVHAYMSCNAEDVQKALEIGIPCTGANDYGAYTSILTITEEYVLNICNVVQQENTDTLNQ